MLESIALTDLAAAVADGETPDWAHALTVTLNESDRDTIAELRFVAAISRTFTTLSNGLRADRQRILLTPGSNWGALRIVGHVGEGRFGDVYRAWDPALDREVALKILRHVDGEDATETQVIEEGRLMARVRHPNVVAIYGAQRIDGVTGLWMEFVNGRTLAAELAERGPFTADELMQVGIELCGALAAVHDAGLVHRDVKAQNVLRDSQGRLVLGDFGTGRQIDLTNPAPTAFAGTPTYVAPELFAGQPATLRSDLYSLGTLLFHLGTRAYPVPGRSLRDIRDAHGRGQQTSLASLRPEFPERMIRVIDRALDPAPSRRFEDARAMARAMESSIPRAKEPRGWRWAATTVAISVAAALVATGWMAVRNRGIVNRDGRIASRDVASPELRPDPAVRSSVFAPAGANFYFHTSGALTLSPDGKLLAFTAHSEGQGAALWIRPLDGAPPRRLDDTEGAFSPFWSSDSTQLGFFTREGLKTIDADEGTSTSRLICPSMAPFSARAGDDLREGTWGKDGVILLSFSRRYEARQIYRSATTGRTCTPLTTINSKTERGHAWPAFLPDGRHFLYHSQSYDPSTYGIYAASLDASGSTFVVRASQGALYDGDGRLVFVRANRLFAAPFDAATSRITGEPQVIAERLLLRSHRPAEGAQFSISRTGMLAYVESGATVVQLKWLDRAGKEIGALPIQHVVGLPAVSHDGTRVVAEVADPETGNSDLWVYDIKRRAGYRLTRHPARDYFPRWSPDDQSIAFVSDRRGSASDIYRVRSDGSNEEFLYGSSGPDDVTSWDGDGHHIVFNRPVATDDRKHELWMYSLANRTAVPLLKAPQHLFAGRMSPDGRWVAHAARTIDKEDYEVWIRGVPPVIGQWRVGRGTSPTWRRDGRELYYIDSSAPRIMSVAIRTGATLEVGTPKPLFSVNRWIRNSYDVSPDGQRFLVLTVPNPQPMSDTPITVVENWPALLKAAPSAIPPMPGQ